MNLIYSTKSKTVWQENHMSFEQHMRGFFLVWRPWIFKVEKIREARKNDLSVVFMINDKASKYIANGL